MSHKKDSLEPVTVKLLGDFTKIEAIREVLRKNFEILGSTPIYENDKAPGYHVYLKVGEACR